MSWQSELDELARRKALVQRMGGEEKVKRQHDAGRMTVRERIEKLVDAGSFQEIGSITGKAQYDADGELLDLVPANCVFGRARIDSRRVVVVGDDFTVRGGSADATIREKPIMAEQMAQEFRLPLVRIIEGSGGGGSVKTIETTGRSNLPNGVAGGQPFKLVSGTLSVVPVVGLGLGSVAGLGAFRLVASHYSVMTKTSAMFVAGPPVVAGIGQKLTKEELGGWQIQTKSGAVDHAVDTEDEALACARRFLSYLPSSSHELPPVVPATDDPGRREEKLLEIVPRDTRKVYKMREIVEAVVDRGSFFEMGRMYGRSLITGFARLGGLPVAVMANDPYFHGGALTADACQKMVRFLDTAETFHLPVVHLVDCPGFLIGLEAEQAGTIRHGARALAALNQTTVPWATVIVRSAYGVGAAANAPAGRLSVRYAWVSGRWGSLPLEGGVSAAYSAEIAAAPDPDAELARIERRLRGLRSPFRSAEAFLIDEIIDPRDTRKLLCDFAELARPLLTPAPSAQRMRP